MLYGVRKTLFDTNISTNYTQADNSICPKGWRLPNASQTDNINNEFGRMFYEAGITARPSNGNNSVGYVAGGFNKLRSSPYYFVQSGVDENGTLHNPGARGYYYPSTTSGNDNAYYLLFDSSGLWAAYNYIGRHYGRSIRCLAR